MSDQASAGRVGVAPSLERCKQCGYWVDELDTPMQPAACTNNDCPYRGPAAERETVARPVTGRLGVAPSREHCQRCAIPLLPNEHTRDRGICHSCWADERAQAASAGPSREPCRVCGRRRPLRRATRDAMLLCPNCWEHYEELCDEEEASWLRETQPEAEIAPHSPATDAPLSDGGALQPWFDIVIRGVLTI